MVELSQAGLRVPVIADELGCGQKTVRRGCTASTAPGWRGWAIWAGKAASGGPPRPSGPGSSPWSNRPRRGGWRYNPAGN
ncbi:hypothetical protein OG266_00250 [Streptomyces sp. NBC_00554]|uniref:hypothetical protein n=1 Tax=Streptomyces sp. NBC_00554 TaxID=2903661 RepID=UPI00352E3AA6|nr:hypothetical protein OG266_00250 [Streptomyces sp. NBC_00554]